MVKKPVTHRIKPPQKAAEKVLMTTPNETSEASQNVNMLITKVNRPSVKIVMGRVSKTRMGLTIELIAERTIEKNMASRMLSITIPSITCQIVMTIKKVIAKRIRSSIFSPA